MFKSGGDPLESGVTWRSHGQHSRERPSALAEEAKARPWSRTWQLLLQPAHHGLCPPWRHRWHPQADAEKIEIPHVRANVNVRVCSYLANSQSVSSDCFPWSTIFSHLPTRIGRFCSKEQLVISYSCYLLVNDYRSVYWVKQNDLISISYAQPPCTISSMPSAVSRDLRKLPLSKEYLTVYRLSICSSLVH